MHVTAVAKLEEAFSGCHTFQHCAGKGPRPHQLPQLGKILHAKLQKLGIARATGLRVQASRTFEHSRHSQGGAARPTFKSRAVTAPANWKNVERCTLSRSATPAARISAS